MNTSKALANHLHQVFFGGNWTVSNIKEHLDTVSFEQAIEKIEGFNSIAQLTYHIHYFVKVQLCVLKNGVLKGSDAESFDHPKIKNEQDWQNFLTSVWNTAEALVEQIKKQPETNWSAHFTHAKYGTYHRNLLGLIEHTHYHLGQIVLLKKWIERQK